MSFFFSKSKQSVLPKNAKEQNREQVREWQRRLRAEIRKIERNIRKIEIEESKIKSEIKIAAKRNDKSSCSIFAKELVRSRKATDRLHRCKAQMNSISMVLSQNMATMRVSDNVKTSTEVMTAMNKLIKVPEISQSMQQISAEMMKFGLIHEMVGDAVDALDYEDIENEADTEVTKVLQELAVDITSKLPSTGTMRLPRGSSRINNTEQVDKGVLGLNAS